MRFATSVVMILPNPTGFNVQNHLLVLHRMKNRDEAIGTAIRLAQEEWPEHTLHTVLAVAIQEPKLVRRLIDWWRS